MKWLNSYKMRLVLVGVVAGIVFSVENTKADITFGKPKALDPPVNNEFTVYGCSFSSDGLELYFSAGPGSGTADGKTYGRRDIWVATRETVDEPWGEPVNLGPRINTSSNDYYPAISPNGLELYYEHGWDNPRIRASTRPSKDALWSNAFFLGDPVNSSHAGSPKFSADGLELYFSSDRPGGSGGYDIWLTRRATINDPWSEPVNLGPNVNSSSEEGAPSISADDRALFFNSDRSLGNWQIWMSKRESKDDNWSQPVNLSPDINIAGEQYDPEVSPDGSTLYFTPPARADGYGADDLWETRIIPIVDLNTDGIVDSADMCIMIEHWGENYSLCDIGPMPWGDGVVDVLDLTVLAEHLFEEDGLLGYWRLDEAEGDIAYNIVSDNHGVLNGNPTWQPDSGQVGGALQFDGIDDCISTDFILNPADSSFSVFAWIKGGEPGQVILSQTGGANWLSIDPSEGDLMTELVPPTTRATLPPLVSETQITNGNWHHIGFVWNGACRSLYVDGIVVAEDIQSNLAGSSNCLYIGAGNNLDAGTFFSGLIDDVRMYNRAVRQ
jgi:hypothetical protein